MTGKVCLITGANAGIGRAAALGLAKTGTTVVMVCRNRQRGEEALDHIRKETGNDSVHLLLADLSSQRSIHDLVSEFKSRYPALHVLINNAGIVPPKRTITEDGLETQFAVNYLAPFLLTSLLLDVLIASAPARVVNVSASYHEKSSPINFDDLQTAHVPYDARSVYAWTKLANIMSTYELARRLQGTGVTVNCLHPGVIETRLMQDFVTGTSPLPEERMAMVRTRIVGLDAGANTIVYVATSPDLEGVTGKYFDKQKAVPSSDASYDETAWRRLWEVTEKIVRTARDGFSSKTA